MNLICKTHKLKRMPSRIRSYPDGKFGCWKCSAESRLKKEPDRIRKWDYEFIGCINHPERPCNRSVYKKSGTRLCGSCSHRSKETGERHRSYSNTQQRLRESGHSADVQRSWRRKRKYMAAYWMGNGANLKEASYYGFPMVNKFIPGKCFISEQESCAWYHRESVNDCCG